MPLLVSLLSICTSLCLMTFIPCKFILTYFNVEIVLVFNSRVYYYFYLLCKGLIVSLIKDDVITSQITCEIYFRNSSFILWNQKYPRTTNILQYVLTNIRISFKAALLQNTIISTMWTCRYFGNILIYRTWNRT